LRKRRRGSTVLHACEERRTLFAPLCVSVDGLMGKECTKFIQRLADSRSLTWHRDYSTTINWICMRLLFAIIRATILCLRGSCTNWRSVNISDGLPLDFIMS
uniref:Uncharacterized protein n=1 Tax=Amphimedon queenslandica TaxID=400682 RepID=A0A1X7ULK0_AMPQE